MGEAKAFESWMRDTAIKDKINKIRKMNEIRRELRKVRNGEKFHGKGTSQIILLRE